jgi:hypothetical protein
MDIKNIFILALLYFYLFDNTEYTLNYYCGLCISPSYFIYDLMFYKLSIDKIIHHFLGICLSICLYFNFSNKDIYYIVDFELSTEISTFFLILYEIAQENNYKLLEIASQLIFIPTFFYYRIYNFFMIQENLISVGLNINTYNYLYFISIYGLFYLNLYWSFLIVKKIYKKISFKFISNTKYSLKIIHYCLITFNGILIIYNIQYFNIYYTLFYIITILSVISNYLYFSQYYLNISNDNNIYIYDYSIFTKYKYCILTQLLTNYYFNISFFYSKNDLTLLPIITAINFISVMIFLYFNNNIRNAFLLTLINDANINLNTGLQILYFAYYTYYNYEFINYFIIFCTILYCMLLTYIIKPFYNTNYLLFQIFNTVIIMFYYSLQ